MPVYFIRAGEDGPVKIGRAAHPESRLRNLSTGSAAPLRLVRVVDGDAREEGIFHRLFHALRLRGEWFKWSAEMLTAAPVLPANASLDLRDTPIFQNLHRVRAWIIANEERRLEIAAEAKVDEKTLRLAAEIDWNPTVKTLQKLEAVIPADWQPPKKARAA